MSVDTLPLVIRRWEDSDCPAIVDLFMRTAFADAIRLPTPRELSPYVGLSLDYYFQDPTSEIMVASCDGEVVGIRSSALTPKP